MRITCKMGTSSTKAVDVQPYEQLNVLLQRLNISDKKTKFMYKGQTYSMYCNLTFQEIEMTDNARIFVNNQGISGEIEEIDLR